MRVKITQSCLTLCSPMDCSPPGSSDHGIFQARVLEWIVISFYQGIFPTQGSNPDLPNCRQTLYSLSHQDYLMSIKCMNETWVFKETVWKKINNWRESVLKISTSPKYMTQMTVGGGKFPLSLQPKDKLTWDRLTVENLQNVITCICGRNPGELSNWPKCLKSSP